MIGHYDYRLVALSVLIAMLASYTALDLAGRTTAARGRVRLTWLAGGATAMGVGIWSMHYIGMLAFSLPVLVLYDWPTVLLSLMAAVFAAAVALFVVSRKKMGWPRALAGSEHEVPPRLWARERALYGDGDGRHACRRDLHSGARPQTGK